MTASIEDHLDHIDWGTQQENGEVMLSPVWEVFVLAISILSVVNLVLVAAFRNPDIDMVFIIMDSILTLFFVADLVRRLSVADDRRAYLVHGWGWVDALAAFPLLRIFRVLRIVRTFRVMVRLGGPDRVFKAFFSNKAAGGLLLVLLIALLVMELGALLVLSIERGAPGSTITTAQDSLWFVLVTMATVGYGDVYPVTDPGRLVGALIIVVGVGVFGTLTGFLANAFLAPSEVKIASRPPGSDDVEIVVDGTASAATEGDAADDAKG